jgi:hypothetical protein
VDVGFVRSTAGSTVVVVNRFFTVAAGTAGACLALLVAAPAAHADAVDDAVNGLRSASVYVAPGVTEPKIDVDQVTRAIGSQPVKIAILPAGDYGSLPKAFGAAQQIDGDLGGRATPLTVGVVAGNNFNAFSSKYCAGAASAVAKDAVEANSKQLQQTGDVTQLIQSFVTGLQSRPLSASSACQRSSASGASDTSNGNSGASGAVPWVLGGIGVVGAGGVGAWVLSRRRRRQKEMEGRRAEVLSLYDRLGADVQNLHGGDNEVARQALADAAERYTATGSQLSQADTHGEFDVARRTALEGLQAARTARKALGIDPGPDLPPIAPAYGEQLSKPQQLQVGDRNVQGYPEYTPGAPYYYGGGGGYPGGWYSFPFWETVLLGSVLSGGFGGGWGGGGYDAGYDRGYEAGQDNAQDSGADWSGGGGDWGGGSWSGGGGGDWGGGGGDWGGGGGDWGGGGGDSGGGSW